LRQLGGVKIADSWQEGDSRGVDAIVQVEVFPDDENVNNNYVPFCERDLQGADRLRRFIAALTEEEERKRKEERKAVRERRRQLAGEQQQPYQRGNRRTVASERSRLIGSEARNDQIRTTDATQDPFTVGKRHIVDDDDDIYDDDQFEHFADDDDDDDDLGDLDDDAEEDAEFDLGKNLNKLQSQNVDFKRHLTHQFRKTPMLFVGEHEGRSNPHTLSRFDTGVLSGAVVVALIFVLLIIIAIYNLYV